MATVDMSHVQFWQPPSDPTHSKQHPTLPHMGKNGISGSTAKQGKTLESDHHHAKSVAASAQPQGRDSAFQQEDKAVEVPSRNNAPNFCDHKADDLPSVNELLAQSSSNGNLVRWDQNSEDTHQHLEATMLKESHFGPKQSSLDKSTSDKLGTQDSPIILENNKLPVLELKSQVTPPSEAWWDIEEARFVDDDGVPLPNQNSLATLHAQPQLRPQMEIQPAFGDQETLPPTPTSSSSQLRHSSKHSHPHINGDHDQGRASNAILDDLGYGSALNNQEVLQKEVVAESSDGEPKPEGRRNKRSCLTTNEKDNSHQYSGDGNSDRNTNNNSLEIGQDPRRTKRRKHIPKASQILSDSPVSALVAEYQEWPFQGFLKRTKMESIATYNLEFQLPYIPEHFNLPISSDTLGNSYQQNTVATTIPPSAMACSKVSTAASKVDFEKSQPMDLAATPGDLWGIRKVIGQKKVGRQKLVLVEWENTWMPESEVLGAKELVNAFLANIKSEMASVEQPLKRGRPDAGQPSVQSVEEPKKRRGRPRKQQ